jgi:hypothetical protein
MSRMNTARISFFLLCLALSLPGFAQSNQRFPAPLGLNKVLSGTVTKPHLAATSPKDAARYLLKTDDATYQLRGHEKELRKMLGKKVRITGNAVGENVTVDTVERLQEK